MVATPLARESEAMLRRTLLKAVASLPLLPFSGALKEVLDIPEQADISAAHLDDGMYVLFVDDKTIEVDKLAALPWSGPPMEIIPLRLNHGQTIEDAVALYKFEKPPEPAAPYAPADPKLQKAALAEQLTCGWQELTNVGNCADNGLGTGCIVIPTGPRCGARAVFIARAGGIGLCREHARQSLEKA